MWIVRSKVPGIGWPGFPDNESAIQLAILQQLMNTQWWPAASIRRQQTRQLAALVRHAQAHVPFYRDRLARLARASTEAAFRDLWSAIPVLERLELQANESELESTADLSAYGNVITVESSGTTGTPVRVKTFGTTRLINGAVNLRAFKWRGWDFAKPYACIRFLGDMDADPPDGHTRPTWGPLTGTVCHTGPGHYLDVHADPAAQVDWLVRRQPAYLVTYPTNLEQLAEHCRRTGATVPSLESVQAISEVLSPEIRDKCRRDLNIRVFGDYSTTEVGCIAVQCPDHDVYHVQAENVLVEVLSPDGTPCDPGEVGRVVVTPLNGLYMPLIRYAVGDLAEVGEPCACGRGLPVLRQIHGRVQGRVIYPDGTAQLPVLNISLFTRVASVRQFQVIQHDVQSMEIKLAVDAPLTAAQEAEIRDNVQADLGYPFGIRFSYSDHIPREPSGKYREFICKVPAATA